LRTRYERAEYKDKYKKAFINGFNKNVIWGLHTLDRTDRQLIIAEGAFDAMSFDVKGYRVLSGISGLKNEQKKIVRGYTEQERKSERDIYICFDNDDAGKNFFKRIAQELITHRLFYFKRLDLPKHYKDISEYFADGEDLQKLLTAQLTE